MSEQTDQEQRVPMLHVGGRLHAEFHERDPDRETWLDFLSGQTYHRRRITYTEEFTKEGDRPRSWRVWLMVHESAVAQPNERQIAADIVRGLAMVAWCEEFGTPTITPPVVPPSFRQPGGRNQYNGKGPNT